MSSVMCLKDCLDEFGRMSRLHMNNNKSEIYFGGIREDVRLRIVTALGMKEGTMPMRYLGAPLHHK